MASLRSRRASTTAMPTKGETCSANDTKQLLDTTGNNNNNNNKERNRALASITSCYRNAFYSTAVDVFTEFSHPSSGLNTLSILLKLAHSLHTLGIGIGLYQCKQVYLMTIDNQSLTTENLTFVFGVLKRVWMTTAIVVSLCSMATSTNLSDYLDDGDWSYLGPLVVLVVSLCCSVGIVWWSSKTTHGDANYDSDHKEMMAAKRDGLLLMQNMLLCIGALYINAAILLVDNVMDPSTSIFEKVYSLTDVAEPIAIAVLLTTLRTQVGQFLQTCITCTRHHTGTASIPLIDNNKNAVNLYKAQEGFYTKISSVFFSAATTKIVSPWLMVFKGFVLSQRDWCHDYSNNKIVSLLAGCE